MYELAVVGRRKVGKTSLIERLIPLLRERGLRVATFKHSSNPHLFNRPGSDTDRMLRAGAVRALVTSPREGALFISAGEAETARARMMLAADCDLLLREGHREAGGPKIWIATVEDTPPEGVIAIVESSVPAAMLHDAAGDSGVSSMAHRAALAGLPRFSFEQIPRLADWVVEQVRGGQPAGAPGPAPGADPASVRRCSITRLAGGEEGRTREEGRSRQDDIVIREERVRFYLNDELLIRVSCLPRDLEAFAVGFLMSEQLVEDPRAIKVTVDMDELAIHVRGRVSEVSRREFRAGRTLTSGCGGGVSGTGAGSGRDGAGPRDDGEAAAAAGECLKIDTELRISTAAVADLMRELREHSPLYVATGGAHAAALADPERGILYVAEDIGRHIAVDKVLGKALIGGTSPAGLILLVSGRLSSEMVTKALAARVPLVVSRSAPTDLAVRLAARHLITLVGFARGRRMNVYSVPERIVHRQ